MVDVVCVGKFEFHEYPLALAVEEPDKVIAKFGIVSKRVIQFHR